MPQLRIIGGAYRKLWQARASGYAAPAKRKSPHLFTGLMKYGRCGRSYVSAGGSKWPRLLCAGWRDAGICDNHPTISARIVEQCTLGAIERDLLDDRVIAEVVREYAAERRRLKASRVQADRRRSRHLGEVERAVKNLITLVEGGADPQSVLLRLKELETERARLQNEGKGADSDVVDTPRDRRPLSDDRTGSTRRARREVPRAKARSRRVSTQFGREDRDLSEQRFAWPRY